MAFARVVFPVPATPFACAIEGYRAGSEVTDRGRTMTMMRMGCFFGLGASGALAACCSL